MYSKVKFEDVVEFKEYSFSLLFCETVTEICASQLLVKELESDCSRLLRIVIKQDNVSLPLGTKLVILSPIWKD